MAKFLSPRPKQPVHEFVSDGDRCIPLSRQGVEFDIPRTGKKGIFVVFCGLGNQNLAFDAIPVVVLNGSQVSFPNGTQSANRAIAVDQ